MTILASLTACGAALTTQAFLKSSVRYVSGDGIKPLPLDGSTLAGAVHIEVADVSGLVAVDFHLETLVAKGPLKVDEFAPFDLDLDTTALPNGSHQLRVVARIEADTGQVTRELSVDFSVANLDSDPPEPPEEPEPPAPPEEPDPPDPPEPPDPPDPPEPPDPPDPPEPPEPPEPTASCLDTQSGPLVTVSGAHTSPYEVEDLAPHARIDARGASFVMRYPGSDHPEDPFVIRNAPYACLSGGVYSPGIPDDEPDWELYHHSQGVYVIDSVGPIVENVAIFETGDAVRFKEETQDWTFRSSYVQHNGDDTIETDQLYAGVVDDVLVDWAYVFLSCRLDTADRGAGYPPGGTVSVSNSLVAMRPQVGAYKATDEGGRIFKWEKHDTPGCLLELRDNVFLVEDGEYASLYLDPSDDPDIDYDSLVHSSGNIIVWLGEGDYPAPIPDGFTLSRDIGVWNAARDAWFDRHPSFESFR